MSPLWSRSTIAVVETGFNEHTRKIGHRAIFLFGLFAQLFPDRRRQAHIEKPISLVAFLLHGIHEYRICRVASSVVVDIAAKIIYSPSPQGDKSK